jgi:hypothetical protein
MLTKEKLDDESKVIDSDEAQKKDKKNIDQLKSYKKRFEPRWYLADAFFEGVHFTYGQKDKDGNWIKVPTPKGKVLREVPKAKKQILAIRNMLLKIKQRPVTYPDRNVIMLDATNNAAVIEKEEQAAIKQGRYVDYYMHEVMKLSRHMKKLIRYAELFNVSYIQILNENGKKSFAVYDPFEVSVYPTISNINDYPRVVKHIAKRLEDLEGNSAYTQSEVAKLKELAKGGKYSDSIYKDSLMKERYGIAPDDSVLIDEIYEIKKITEGEGETATEQERCVIKSYVGDIKIREEVTKLSKIPIAMFCWGDEAYQTSLMEDMMPLNKAYDLFISKLEQKAKKLDTGRIILQKGEDAKVLTTNDGEFIRYKRVKPEVMEEASVPNAFMEMINMLDNDLREQGVAMFSSAQLPTGVKAWRAIETLKESDFASVGTQQDNLNECLTDIAEKLIEMLAQDMTEIETVQVEAEKEGETDAFKVVGKSGADILGKDKLNDVVVIDPNRTTKVEIESGISWTEEAKKDLAIELLGAKAISIQSALEMLKVGNSQEIMDQMIKEQTQGKSIIDMPEFKMLPRDLQQAIAAYLAQGAPAAPANEPDVVA